MKISLPVLLPVTAFLGLAALFSQGCTYESGVIEPPLPPVDSTLVSFQDDVIPIFDADCNSSGCHNTGGVPPDLTAPNAYEALWDGNFIDTIVPEDSELLQWMLGNRGLSMPLSGPNEEYNTTVFNWINQGAQNN